MIDVTTINSVINHLTTKLSVPASQITSALMGQIKSAIIFDTLYLILLIVIFPCIVKVIILLINKIRSDQKQYKEMEWKWGRKWECDDSLGAITALIVMVLALIGSLVLIGHQIYWIATEIWNPHYWVLVKIINLLSGN
jgi:heme/copper-type cytochrome/quinol oxidase subunit 2